MAKLAKLKDLASRAGQWLGLATTPVLHTTAIAGDRFDQMTWRDTYDQAAALRDLAAGLGEHHDYATDLLSDVFLAAYKTAPQLRPGAEMEPSRMVNHQVTAAMLASPEFAELRRETAGDPYAAAMAVITQGPALHWMLEKAEQAQQAAQAAADARRAAADAAQDVADALERADRKSVV